MKRVLAVASGGGHWKQLMLMRTAFDQHDCTYITTIPGLPEENGIAKFEIIQDCNKHSKIDLLKAFMNIVLIVNRLRPEVVISTGAAPGLLALVAGKFFGSTTVWVDSIANAEELSLAGRLAKKFSSHTFSQWQHVAEKEGVNYGGGVF